MASTGGLINEDLLELRRLVKGADSIELKLTLPELSYRSAATALGVDPLDAQIRQVFFFDTPDLDLNRAGVVTRARRVQGRDHDSVIKLRPVTPADLPRDLRRLPEFVVDRCHCPGGERPTGRSSSWPRLASSLARGDLPRVGVRVQRTSWWRRSGQVISRSSKRRSDERIRHAASPLSIVIVII